MLESISHLGSGDTPSELDVPHDLLTYTFAGLPVDRLSSLAAIHTRAGALGVAFGCVHTTSSIDQRCHLVSRCIHGGMSAGITRTMVLTAYRMNPSTYAVIFISTIKKPRSLVGGSRLDITGPCMYLW